MISKFECFKFLITKLPFKDKMKKQELPKYSFNLKDALQILKDNYEITKEDSLQIFEKMVEREWIESINFDDKKIKEASLYKLVNLF